MAEKKPKPEENPKPKEQPENAATNYGLEGHEATLQDPRVTEMRHPGKPFRSTSTHKPSISESKSRQTVVVVERPPGLADSRSRVNVDQPPSSSTPAPVRAAAPVPVVTPSQYPAPTSSSDTDSETHNAATDFGMEDHKANMQDQRVINMRHPGNQRDRSVIQSPSNAHAGTPAVGSPKPVVKSYEAVPPAPPITTIYTPPPKPLTEQPVQESQKGRPLGVSKNTNTDVSFDPSKMYASKTTNTSGNLYTDDEEKVPPMSSKPFDLDECFAFAVALVKRAGAFALAANQSRLSYTTKQHEHDLHTRTDNEVEEMIVQAVVEKYPDHKIIAEEAVSQSETGQVTLTNEPTWIIDPIDGTMNFVHHFPYYCISVALLINKVTSFGIVFNPPLQECYTARLGQGAQINGERMVTSGQNSLKRAMILQEYSSGMNDSRTSVAMVNARRLIKETHALRSIGSSAMGLAMVASGVADGFYFFGLHVWDMAAGNLLVTEAGGSVMDPAGGEVDIMSRRVLAAATHTLALQLSNELAQNYPSPRDDQPRSINPNEYYREEGKKDFNAQTEFSESSLSSSDLSDDQMQRERNNDAK